MPVEFEELELPFDEVVDQPATAPPVEPATPDAVGAPAPTCAGDLPRSPLGTFPCCPLCGGELRPEHAHYRCACGWRDSCCD